jgi:CrcB protein
MKDALAVMAGGAIGSLVRWLAYVFIDHFRWAEVFPYSTIFVNVTGSFGIGLMTGLMTHEGLLSSSPTARLLLLTGFFGGYTTFSTFSFQTLELMRDNEFIAAGLNMLLSLGLCLAAVWLGTLLAYWISSQLR